jgi:glycosyltransferase involved in cell wall biosynthesis
VPPTAYGGIESVVDTLATGLVEAGHEVVLAASADSTCEVERMPGFAPSNPAILGESLPELRHITLAYAALEGVDIVHDHTLIGPAYRNRPRGVPSVATVHGPFVPPLLDIYRAVSAEVSLVAISQHQASTADGVHIERVIHHGIRQSDVPVGDGKGGYACFLGRMHPDKGVLQAIEISRRAGIPLRIAAKMREAVERDYFTSVIRPLLGPGIEFLGELDSQGKYELLGGALAMINPIQWDEPFGMVMIESLAAGTPVLATPRGSAPEIIDDGITGFLRTELQQQVEALASIEDLERTRCVDAVKARFSAERMTQRHVELYSALRER